jgi:hypothetical protein
MSNIIETIKVTGALNVTLTGPNGEIKETFETPNLVVTTGKNFIAARLATTGQPTQMSHMALGTSATAPLVADTTLGAEIGRVALSTAGGSPTSNTVVYNALFGAGIATGAITEAGLFNGSSGSTMLCRTTFNVVNKGPDDTLSITWTISIN